MKVRKVWTDDEARIAVLVARAPHTVTDLVRATDLSLRAVLVALNQMLNRYRLHEDIAWRLSAN